MTGEPSRCFTATLSIPRLHPDTIDAALSALIAFHPAVSGTDGGCELTVTVRAASIREAVSAAFDAVATVLPEPRSVTVASTAEADRRAGLTADPPPAGL